MRGHFFSTDGSMKDGDLIELVDELAIMLTNRMGEKVYALNRQDVAELLEPFIEDIEDLKAKGAIPWLVWDLLQEGMAEYFSDR